MAHEYLYDSPPPTHVLVFDGCTYELGWDGLRSTSPPDSPAMPTLDYATHLVNIVKFHCGQMFHLFDEVVFMSNLKHYYATQSDGIAGRELWYVHFLLILAFGKAFTARKGQSSEPPGADFFVTALRLLPDTVFLLRDPVSASEVLCCVALYLQCIDFRLMAHSYVRLL